VITPNTGSIVPSVVGETDHVPGVGVAVSVVGVFTHAVSGLGTVGTGFTVTFTHERQPVTASVSHTFTVPAAVEVNTPGAPRKLPPPEPPPKVPHPMPGVLLENVRAPVRHTLSVPVGTAGIGFTVTVIDTEQSERENLVVIVATPGLTPVTMPVDPTVATDRFELLQVTPVESSCN